jgi:hypothetical protein
MTIFSKGNVQEAKLILPYSNADLAFSKEQTSTGRLVISPD